MRAERPSKIPFIGFLDYSIPLIGPSNTSKCTPDKILIFSVAVVIYVVYYLAYDIIMPANPPSWAEIPSWVVVMAFVVSYVAFRLAGGLKKTHDRWTDSGASPDDRREQAGSLKKTQDRLDSKLVKIIAFAIVFAAVLVLAAITYSCFAELVLFQSTSLGGDTSEEHTEPNSAGPNQQSSVTGPEATEDIDVIETEWNDYKWEVGVERNTVYLASATIVAFTTFGSLVSVRVFGDPKTLKSRTLGFGMIFSGVLVVIVCQSALMHGACCSGISVTGFSCFFLWTVAAIMSIAYGSILILDAELQGKKGFAISLR